MKHTRKKSSAKAWDSRELGASAAHVRKASVESGKILDDRLGLQTISIRLQKGLINDLKELAEEDGIGYQPFMRQILMRYVRQIQHERLINIKRDKRMPANK